ncbi:MAG: hypothetical protein HN731_10825 [Rhodospirillaceae bacterium]|jgi:hypothetical protein|nr:hypothetical protein [Rhodospirillaceae bacterium]
MSNELSNSRQQLIKLAEIERSKATLRFKTESEADLFLQSNSRHRPTEPVRNRYSRQGKRFPSRSKGRADLRRRARHAAQGLPWKYRVDFDLTDTDILVLHVHYRLAGPGGSWEPSVAEIASRAAVSPRSVIYAHKKLVAFGLLTVEERRQSAFRNETNVYTLTPALVQSKPQKKSEFFKGAKPCAAKGESSLQLSTPNQDRAKSGVQKIKDPSPAISVRKVSKSSAKRRRCEIPQSPSSTELKIACVANSMIDPMQPKRLNLEEISQRADELLAIYCPNLYRSIWRDGIAFHGFKAILAVFETALLYDADHVHTPHGYLSGILRKSADECHPELTLSRLFAARSNAAKKIAAEKVAGGPEFAPKRRVVGDLGSRAL